MKIQKNTCAVLVDDGWVDYINADGAIYATVRLDTAAEFAAATSEALDRLGLPSPISDARAWRQRAEARLYAVMAATVFGLAGWALGLSLLIAYLLS